MCYKDRMIPVCPKCDTQLFILKFQEIEVDFCHRCRGLWIDAGELEDLLRRTGAHADDPLLLFQQQTGSQAPGRQHLCPRCDRPLHEINVGTALTLDRCPASHGLWFDEDELQRLLATSPPQADAHRTIEYLNNLLGSTPMINQGGSNQ